MQFKSPYSSTTQNILVEIAEIKKSYLVYYPCNITEDIVNLSIMSATCRETLNSQMFNRVNNSLLIYHGGKTKKRLKNFGTALRLLGLKGDEVELIDTYHKDFTILKINLCIVENLMKFSAITFAFKAAIESPMNKSAAYALELLKQYYYGHYTQAFLMSFEEIKDKNLIEEVDKELNALVIPALNPSQATGVGVGTLISHGLYKQYSETTSSMNRALYNLQQRGVLKVLV